METLKTQTNSSKEVASVGPAAPTETVVDSAGDELVPLNVSTALLRDNRLPTVQRQAIVQRIGKQYGNKFLTKFISSLKPDALASVQRIPDQAQQIAFEITGGFEGGKPDSIQTIDAGIISYGKHQATLASGSLYKILKSYTELSKSDTATKISGYLSRVEKKDATLKDDKDFIQLLKDAAKEPEMNQAQDEKFIELYWNPAKKSAAADGVTSPLGEAIYYDTNIQGGLDAVRTATKKELDGKKYTEQEFLQVFLEKRKDRLKDIAKVQAASKSKAKQNNAKMLEHDASDKGRVGQLETLLSKDPDLKGDQNQQFSVGSRKIFGFDSAYRKIIAQLTPDTSKGEKQNFPEAYRILNGLSMSGILTTLDGLKKGSYLSTLIQNFPLASDAGVNVPRLEIALQAVEKAGTADPTKFKADVMDKTVSDLPEDQQKAITDYLASKLPKPKAKHKTKPKTKKAKPIKASK